MNAMEWNRDLRNNVATLRQLEQGMDDKPDRGRATVSFPDLRKGNIGIVVATQIARFVKPDSLIPGWNSPQQAWAQTQAQIAWYKCMEEEGELVAITDKQSLQQHIALWNDGTPNDKKPIGYILSLEGADSIVDVSYVERAYHYGLRAIGPAHYGPGRYANGTDSTGKMNDKGIQLLKEMERLNIIWMLLIYVMMHSGRLWIVITDLCGLVIIIAGVWLIITGNMMMNKLKNLLPEGLL